jgi:hypothetical protein
MSIITFGPGLNEEQASNPMSLSGDIEWTGARSLARPSVITNQGSLFDRRVYKRMPNDIMNIIKWTQSLYTLTTHLLDLMARKVNHGQKMIILSERALL